MEPNFSFSFLRNLTGSYRLLIILTSALIISLLLPRIKSITYEFEEGSKWKYSDLRAPYDFAIRKTDSELAKEKDEIQKTFTPYYKKNEAITDNLEDNILEEYNLYKNKVQGDTALFLTNFNDFNTRLLKDAFSKIYKDGVIESNDQYKDREKDFLIQIVDGNTLTLRPRAAISGISN